MQPFLDTRKEFQHLGHALVRGFHAQRDAAELQVFVDAQIAKQVAPLGYKGDAARQQGFGVGAGHVLAVERDAALTRLEQTKQGFEHGGLARAVWAHQQRDRAGAGRERQLVEDHEILVASHHVFELNAGVAHHQFPR